MLAILSGTHKSLQGKVKGVLCDAFFVCGATHFLSRNDPSLTWWLIFFVVWSLLASPRLLLCPQVIELSSYLEKRIAETAADANKSVSEYNEIGKVVTVGDGIARVYGLNNVQAGEVRAHIPCPFCVTERLLLPPLLLARLAALVRACLLPGRLFSPGPPKPNA